MTYVLKALYAKQFRHKNKKINLYYAIFLIICIDLLKIIYFQLFNNSVFVTPKR